MLLITFIIHNSYLSLTHFWTLICLIFTFKPLEINSLIRTTAQLMILIIYYLFIMQTISLPF